MSQNSLCYDADAVTEHSTYIKGGM